MRVIYCLTPCQVNPTPSDSAPEYVPLPMLLSERLVEEMLSAVQVENSRPFVPRIMRACRIHPTLSSTSPPPTC